MFPMDYDKGAQFIKENEPGNFVYVMESGKALASRNEKVLFKIFPGKLFGEPQAMLYNSPRWVLLMSTSCRHNMMRMTKMMMTIAVASDTKDLALSAGQ